MPVGNNSVYIPPPAQKKHAHGLIYSFFITMQRPYIPFLSVVCHTADAKDSLTAV